MEQHLRKILCETLYDYRVRRIGRLDDMHIIDCGNEKEKNFHSFAEKMERKVDIIELWMEFKKEGSEILLDIVIRHLAEEILDDFYKYASKELGYKSYEIEWRERVLRNIKVLRGDFLNFFHPELRDWDKDEEFMETDQTEPDF
ncbi:TPA: hypothetical protein ACGW7B_002261 [Bacillus nitratireducens]|uniref:hypothetical protein n=1 Tax=Bacillus wiedmannii TaxID=1890302 RepID=UPI000BF16C7C|nr:hypothetical protein [Bacillus wiedmannii]PEI76317.1 hypothetical protein CN905_17280 [Bacillus wiedmannii]